MTSKTKERTTTIHSIGVATILLVIVGSHHFTNIKVSKGKEKKQSAETVKIVYDNQSKEIQVTNNAESD